MLFFGVTPCVGVWIEIALRIQRLYLLSSLPAWECGLKSDFAIDVAEQVRSLPAWECGLK